MTRTRARASAALLTFVAATAFAQEPPTREQEWREDIEHLRKHAPRMHVDLFRELGSDEFHGRLDDLAARIGTLTDAEIVLELAALAADVGDGHTETDLGPTDWNGFGRLPLGLYRFGDEIRITAVDEVHGALAGGRVVAVEGQPIDQVFERVAELVSHDNTQWIDEVGARYLTVPEVLHALGVTESPQGARLLVERLDGELVEARLDRVEDDRLYPFWSRSQDPQVEKASFPMVSARDRSPSASPLHLSRDDDHWYSYHEPTDAVFVQLNRISHPDGGTLADLVGEAMARFHQLEASHFILDLRHNGGGDNYLNREVLVRLAADRAINRPEVLAVIIGRATYSAASHLATLLESHTRATFYGEATGASPNHYGDAKPIHLPNSGMKIGFSGAYWQNSRPYPFEQRPWTDPDVVAAPEFELWLANRDPAVEAIIEGRRPPSPLRALRDAYEQGGLDAALAVIRSQLEDPDLRFRLLVRDHRVFVSHLAGLGELNDALRAAKELLEIHPGSPAVMRDIGDVYRLLERPGRARKWYERAAAAAPDGLAYGRAHVSLQDLEP